MLVSKNQELNAKIKELRGLLSENISDKSSVKNWHVNQCINSIQRCLKRMDRCKTEKHAYRNIARSVLSLNVINWAARGELIYTMEREDIAEILNDAAILKGLNPSHEDMTEDFRTW